MEINSHRFTYHYFVVTEQKTPLMVPMTTFMMRKLAGNKVRSDSACAAMLHGAFPKNLAARIDEQVHAYCLELAKGGKRGFITGLAKFLSMFTYGRWLLRDTFLRSQSAASSRLLVTVVPPPSIVNVVARTRTPSNDLGCFVDRVPQIQRGRVDHEDITNLLPC